MSAHGKHFYRKSVEFFPPKNQCKFFFPKTSGIFFSMKPHELILSALCDFEKVNSVKICDFFEWSGDEGAKRPRRYVHRAKRDERKRNEFGNRHYWKKACQICLCGTNIFTAKIPVKQ